jgi:transposase
VSQEDWEGTPPNVQVVVVEQATEIERLNEIVRFLLVTLYGPKAEKSKKKDRLEHGDAELPPDEPTSGPATDGDSERERAGPSETPEPSPAPEPDPPPPPAPGKGRGRKKLAAHLPRRQVILDVPDADKLCRCCGREKPSFVSDDDITEKYGFIRAQLFVWQYVRRKYKDCPCPKQGVPPAAGSSTPATAPDSDSAGSPAPGASSPEDAPAETSPATLPTITEVGTPGELSSGGVSTSSEPALDTDPIDLTTSHPVHSNHQPGPVAATPGSSVSVDTPDRSDPPFPPCPTSQSPAASASTMTPMPAPIILTLPSNRLPGAPLPSIVVAPPLPQLIRKGLATHSLLVQIIISKVLDGMPLYRQAAQFLRLGIDIDRTTMCGWLIQLGRVLACIMAALRLEVRSGRVVHADETPVAVLAELARKASTQCYMWVFAGGRPGMLAVEFLYDSSRGAKVPRRYLEGYQGDVLTDGYAGYDFLLKWVGIVLLACWVHVRRKFHDVIKAMPKELRGKNTFAQQVLARIRVLYRLEKYADQQHFTDEQRRELRQQHAKPVIDALKVMLEKKQPDVPPKTKLGEAIAYALHLWPRLLHYLDEGYRPLDNNWVENLIRPFAVGRRNWLFCATEEGAIAMGTFHSLVATATLNGLDPATYLRALFDQLAILLETADPIHGPTPEQCRALLPQYIDRKLLEAEVLESRYLLSA